MSEEHPHPSDVAQPTAKEAYFFLTILSNMKNKPDVDWDVVAKKAGFNNAKTATTRYSQIKKKLGWNEESTLPAGLPPAQRTPGKKRASPKANGSGTNTSPSKVRKPRTPKTPKSSDKKEEAVKSEPVPETHYESPDEEEHDEEMSGSKQEMVYEHHEEEVTYYDTPDA